MLRERGIRAEVPLLEAVEHAVVVHVAVRVGGQVLGDVEHGNVAPLTPNAVQAIEIGVGIARGVHEAALAQGEYELAQHHWPHALDDLLPRAAVAQQCGFEHELRAEGGERMDVLLLRTHQIGGYAAQVGDGGRQGITHDDAPVGAVEVVAAVLLDVASVRAARGGIDGVLNHAGRHGHARGQLREFQ